MYTPRTGFSPSRTDIKTWSLGIDLPMGSPDTSVYYDPVTATLAVAGSNIIGSSMAGRSAERAADTSADAQREAARLSAIASTFRPVGMTTRFGRSQFTMGTDPETGLPILTGAEYAASPEIKAFQDRLMGMAGTSLSPEAQQRLAENMASLEAGGRGLFNLGRQYLATSPEAARKQYISEQQALLDPIRRREEDALARSVFGRGRAGLSVGAQGQPELATLAAARRTQDLQLAAAADQAAQQRAQFGAGLFGTGANLIGSQYGLQTQALAPFLQQFGAAQALEQAALQPLELGANLGGRAVNTAGASALLQGGINAANTRLQGSLVGPTLMTQGISNIGSQYLQNQQQNALFDRLYGPQGRNVNVYGAGYRGPQLNAGQAADYFVGGNYAPSLFESAYYY